MSHNENNEFEYIEQDEPTRRFEYTERVRMMEEEVNQERCDRITQYTKQIVEMKEDVQLATIELKRTEEKMQNVIDRLKKEEQLVARATEFAKSWREKATLSVGDILEVMDGPHGKWLFARVMAKTKEKVCIHFLGYDRHRYDQWLCLKFDQYRMKPLMSGFAKLDNHGRYAVNGGYDDEGDNEIVKELDRVNVLNRLIYFNLRPGDKVEVYDLNVLKWMKGRVHSLDHLYYGEENVEEEIGVTFEGESEIRTFTRAEVCPIEIDTPPF